MTAAAKLIGTFEPRSPEWFAARRPGITATEISAVMGISPWTSPFALYWRKLGVLGEQPDNTGMSLGRHMEPWVADRYAEAHPDLLVAMTGMWRSVERPWQIANPDRLLYQRVAEASRVVNSVPPGLLEIKKDASYDGWGEDGSDDVPVQYRAQVLWQLDVFGLPVGRLACLFLHSQTIREYVIGYDPADVEVMRSEALAFLDRIARRDPPPVDHMPSTRAALKQLHPTVEDREVQATAGLGRRYAAACTRAKAAEQKKAHYENQIRERLGAAKTLVDPDGNKIAARVVYDRKPYTVAATTVDSIRPARGKTR